MQDIQNTLNDMRLIAIDFSNFENKGEEEKKEMLRLFLENINFIRDFVFQKRKEIDDDIIDRNNFIKFLDSLIRNPKIAELVNKEIELIRYLKEDAVFLESIFLTIGHLENIISSSEKEDKLKYDIDTIIDFLKKEGIIKNK